MSFEEVLKLNSDSKSLGGFKIEVHLEGIHAGHGQIIGELVRMYKVEPGPFYQVVGERLSDLYTEMARDLSVQLYDSWKQGTFGTTSVSLVLTGSLNYNQLNQFKKLLVQRLQPIKQIRERLFEPSRVTFELDSDVSSRELANHLKKEQFPRFRVEVVGVSGSQIDISISGL